MTTTGAVVIREILITRDPIAIKMIAEAREDAHEVEAEAEVAVLKKIVGVEVEINNMKEALKMIDTKVVETKDMVGNLSWNTILQFHH
jgi:hypothetical protein